MAFAAAAERNDSGIALSIAVLKQRFGERLSTSGAMREQHGHTTSWIPNQPPDAVIFVENAERGRRDRARLRGASHARHRLRHRHVAGGAPQRAGRRHLRRPVAHEPHRRRARRRSRLRGGAGRHAQAAEYAPARRGAVLPDRPRRRCEPRRHGGDARLRHQRRALRHDEGQRAEPDGGDAGRVADQDGEPRQEDLGRLRPDAAPDRLGRHARHHHRADAPPAGHPAGDLRRGVQLPERRGGLPHGDRDHPVRHPDGAHRAARRAAGARLQRLFEAGPAGDARCSSWSSTARRRASRSRRRSSARSRRSSAATASAGRRARRTGRSSGRRATTSITR